MNQHHFGLTFLGLLGILTMQGQVVIDQNFTLDQYVNEILLGEGVTASNISLIGDPIQLAKLTDPSGNFSVTNGLVLSCGDPNRLADCQGDMNPTGLGTTFNDPDLLNVANSVPPLIGQSFTVSAVNDGCVLEFDFEAGGDSISFNYVFGSDEYLAWVNSQFNDIFAFFLSGPGISGPFAAPAEFPDGAINIAEVPGSDPVLPITISSVNDVINSEFYIDNPNPGPDDICINGYTTTFTASAAVQCGETYHIKLAIADGSDDFLESVVVLEAGSFSSNAVNLEADAVPFAANGLQNLVPYEDALGLPAVFSYPNGESFPFAAWSADNEMTITVDGQESVIDAVIIEGCNDAQFTIIRPEAESDLLDTLYLGLEGTAFLGLDYSDTFNQVVMNPGQTESEITLGVVDDGADEGVEYVQITYTYINGCGEEITTTSRVVILDPLPVEVTPMTVPCQGLDGTQELGYDNVTGYGPFRYVWGGNAWNNAWEDAADWTTSFDSIFSVLDAEGELVPELTVAIEVIDQCGKVYDFEQQVRFPIIFDDEICLDDRQDFPALNGDVFIEDVRYNGASLITGTPLGNLLRVDASPVGDRYKLNEIISGTEPWEGVITLVDTCGYETEATIKVRDCVIPNVFTPNNDASNDNFRIRGLTGFGGSQLLIYNRNGTVVFTDETLNDTEFELVWGGRYANGDLAPEGTYQWVLLRSDGYKESGLLTLVRKL
jgi:gliding motility-associated-like protein